MSFSGVSLGLVRSWQGHSYWWRSLPPGRHEKTVAIYSVSAAALVIAIERAWMARGPCFACHEPKTAPDLQRSVSLSFGCFKTSYFAYLY